MDETTYSTAELIELINDQLIPIRVDADQHPHVQDRYIAGGWPTNAFLTPTGEVLWSGTYVAAEQFTQVASGVLSAWSERRAELKSEMERRRKALEAARGRQHVVGLVRREAVDDVLSATIDAYDERHGGFGTEPKFPYVDAVELLLIHGARSNPEYLRMAEHTLDGMLAGALWDSVEGGFYRYATAADWTAPRLEKLLGANAALLRIYALGAHVRARADWRTTSERIVAWVDKALLRDDGFWAASEGDDVVYTNYNAQWVRALAYAGARFDNTAWIAAAVGTLDRLLQLMAAPGDMMNHFRREGEAPQIGFLLTDAVDTARACIAVAQASGESRFLEHARRLAGGIERALWAEDGGFWERSKGADEVGVLKYREKPFDGNAEAARLLNDLALATGEKSYRAQAERILALLSPQAGRYGVAGAPYALAGDEFFDPPTRVFVVGAGADADALRTAALTLPLVNGRVWQRAGGGRIDQLDLARQASAVAYIATARGMSPPISQPAKLQEALATLR